MWVLSRLLLQRADQRHVCSTFRRFHILPVYTFSIMNSACTHHLIQLKAGFATHISSLPMSCTITIGLC